MYLLRTGKYYLFKLSWHINPSKFCTDTFYLLHAEENFQWECTLPIEFTDNNEYNNYKYKEWSVSQNGQL